MSEPSYPVPALRTIDLRHLPWVRRLPADYADGFDKLAPFYAGNPSSPDAWRQAIARAQQFPRDRQALADLLQRQQTQRDAPREARAAAERLRDAKTVAVVTGQQAGLLGGPLFTLLKALTAIRLARRIEREHGTPAVAVFWIDSEDHDWNEVASVTLLDADHHPRTLTLPPPPGANVVPVARILLDESIEALLGHVRDCLAPTEFTDELIAELRRAYRGGVSMADAFGQWLEHLLGPRGLVLYNCADLAAKPLAAPVFIRELSKPGHTWQLASDAGAALESLGYHAQVGPHPDGIALFHLNARREAIRHEDHEFVAGDERFAAADLIRTAERAPQHFSPNVLLRPLVQDKIFPTVAYVSGPSELAYLGQLKAVYAHFGIPMPLVVPRATATLLDSAAVRFMSRYHLDLDHLRAQDEAELNRLLEAQLPKHVEAALHEAQRSVEDRMNAVIVAVPSIDPTLEGAARSTLGRMEHDLRGLFGKVIHAAKKRDETLRRQFVRARALVFPEGHPQERTLGFVWFLNRYGPALVDVLERELPADGRVHAVLTP